MSLCKKYDCIKCEAFSTCGGCEKNNGSPFGKCCVATCIIKEKGFDEYLSIEKKIIDSVNNLNIDELKIDHLNILPGEYVNISYPLDSGEIKLLKDDQTYFANQIETSNKDRCFGIVSDGKFLIVAEYGCNGVNPKLVLYKRL